MTALQAVPDEDARHGEPAVRRGRWLADHPGGTIGPPEPDQLRLRAVVHGTVIAMAYADLSVLMDRVDAAEARGDCPLHPAEAA